MLWRTLSRNLPTYLTTGLANVLQKAYHWKLLLEQSPERNPHTIEVYDLVNCGPSTRFRTSTGLIAHNCLGLGYGMQPKKMVKQMYEQGVSITFQEASDFFNTYWGLFADVRKFSMKLQNQVKHDGFIINPFGYRMVCEPRLAFNYFIQSSVSGIMHVFLAKLVAAAPYSTFYTVIHDELLMEVDDHMLDQFRIDTRLATDSLNEDLNWSVKIRTGFVAGKDLYNAK